MRGTWYLAPSIKQLSRWARKPANLHPFYACPTIERGSVAGEDANR